MTHSKKKRKTGEGGQENGGLFSGDGLGKPGGGAAGSSSSGGSRGGEAGGRQVGKKKDRASRLPKAELNRLKRGGKGKKAFKSKKKHKRR
jgi:ATP-dependent RNA helicase DDX27